MRKFINNKERKNNKEQRVGHNRALTKNEQREYHKSEAGCAKGQNGPEGLGYSVFKEGLFA